VLAELRSIASASDPEQLRERLAPALISAGLGEARMLEMLLAATELGTNALQHGGGIADTRVGQAHGRFVCEIIDEARLR
jgi:anti-sigma regulatory factor (Ser/Thr protein kinase)